MRDVSIKLWMKVVAFRKPLILIALLVFGFVVIYELSKGPITLINYVASLALY